MGVEEVYDFLKENKGFHTAKDIYTKLSLNQKSVSKSLNTISRYEDIMCKFIHLDTRQGIYKSGLRTKKAWVYAHVNQIKKQRS